MACFAVVLYCDFLHVGLFVQNIVIDMIVVLYVFVWALSTPYLFLIHGFHIILLIHTSSSWLPASFTSKSSSFCLLRTNPSFLHSFTLDLSHSAATFFFYHHHHYSAAMEVSQITWCAFWGIFGRLNMQTHAFLIVFFVLLAPLFLDFALRGK